MKLLNTCIPNTIKPPGVLYIARKKDHNQIVMYTSHINLQMIIFTCTCGIVLTVMKSVLSKGKLQGAAFDIPKLWKRKVKNMLWQQLWSTASANLVT